MFFANDMTIDFERFLETLSVFSHKVSVETKLEFAYKVFDVDGSGRVSRNNMFVILFLIVGKSMSVPDIKELVNKTFNGLGVKPGEEMTYDVFKEAMESLDMKSLMTISF